MVSVGPGSEILAYIEILGFLVFLLAWVSYPDPYPDPHGSALIWVAGSGSGSRRAKMTHKNRKKSRIFMFLRTGCSLLRAEGFSCSLGVLYVGLGIGKL
jgi:hypothetical protein